MLSVILPTTLPTIGIFLYDYEHKKIMENGRKHELEEVSSFKASRLH